MPAPLRLAVIGAVGALAVGIGLAAGSFLLEQRTAAVGSAAEYVPGDAPFYLEVRLEPSDAQDDALRDVLARFPEIDGVDLEQPLYAQAVDAIDELLLAQEVEVSWTEDVEPWFDGRLAMALTEVPAELLDPMADPTAMPDVPPFVVFLGVTDRAAAEAALDRLVAAAGSEVPTFTDIEYGGFTIRTVNGEDGAYVLTGDQLLIGGDPDVLRAALDARASGSGTLDEVAEMTRLTDRLPDDWLAFMTFDMTDVLAAATDAAASVEPSAAAVMEELLASQPLRGAMVLSAAGDRVVIDAATDAPSGVFSAENANRGLADEVPADALYYSEAGNIGESFAAVIESIKSAVPEGPGGREELDMVESALGADLEELVSWIEDGAICIGYVDDQPYAGLVLVPIDRDAAERRLGQLATFATLAASDPASGISVGEEEVGGVAVTTIRWQDPAGTELDPMMPGMPSVLVEYAVTDDRVLVGVGDRFVRRALELDEGDSLASVARYTDAVAEVGGPDNAGAAWIDLVGVREALETALGAMAGELGATETYEADIRPWLLPLDRFVSVSRLEGDVLVQRAALLVE